MQQDSPTFWYDELQPQRFDQGTGLPPPGTQFTEWETIFQDESTSGTSPYQSPVEPSGVPGNAYEDLRIGGNIGDDRPQTVNTAGDNPNFDANLQDNVGRVGELSNGVDSSVESVMETVEDWE